VFFSNPPINYGGNELHGQSVLDTSDKQKNIKKKTYPPTRPFETVINYILQKGWFFWPCQHSKVGSPTTIQWFRKSKVAHDQEKHSISTQKHPTNLHFHKVMIENPAILKTTKGCFSEKSPTRQKRENISEIL
jgi:hypothetical protein